MPQLEAQGKIRSLPPLLVNQIAAGEVVERPASVVKELLDNAIDAGASRIAVELEQGGVELVRVSDNGAGIPADDLPLAVAPHATSKIRAVEDLDRIGTMGFRGEALASIMSVSRLSMRSRTAAQQGAALLEAEGDSVGPARPTAGPVGTSVAVRNLFFNTPARRKFLRTPTTEQSNCMEVVYALALSHPAIGFSCTCDGRAVLDLPPNQSPRQRILAVLGAELEPELIEVSQDGMDGVGGGAGGGGGVALWGLVGRPSIARGNARFQYVFVNGRPVRDKTIQHALREAYRGLIEPGRYPTAVLLIELDPGAVDVNVHPAKVEVRFRDQSMIHSLVLRTVRDALRAADLTPAYRGHDPASAAPLPASRWTDLGPGNVGAQPGGRVGGAGGAGGGGGGGPTGFADYFKRVLPGQVGGRLSYDAIRDALRNSTGVDVGAPPPSPLSPSAALPPHPLTDAPPADAPANPAEPSASSPVGMGVEGVGQVGGVGGVGEGGIASPQPIDRVLQVHNSYVVTQDAHGLVIVDQHALHERVMFEALLARLGEGSFESQRLLTPVVVPCSVRQLARLPELEPLLARLGIEAQPLGPSSVGVQAFPTILFDRGVDAGEFFHDLLDRCDDDDFVPGTEAAVHEILDMMACKAAVKAGDRMSESELKDLLSLRELVERSSNCPHGRPTTVRLTIRELERLFGRT